ncbi:MAG TPA: pyridoxal-dependent decarboxylase [Stellaceae bacterium]|nr:pyridoxal-dependent decarboxylase [Stellaceae bacterium]
MNRRDASLSPGRASDTLDPADWEALRRSFHAAIDQALDRLRDIRQEPVWRPTPEAVKARLGAPLPRQPQSLDAVVQRFADDILPYGTGNIHPRFFGWVHGAGNPAGALGEALAALMNCNVGGRDHVAVYVERQVIDWCKAIFAYPAASSGLLTSGTSMGTIIALAAARAALAEVDLRRLGMAASPRPLVGYASSEAHSSIAKAFELLGFGRAALRLVPADAAFRLPLPRLAEMIAADRAAGAQPAVVVASAGTVNTGAIDDLAALAALCRAEGLWLHVDAAFGGLAVLTPDFAPRLAAVAEADSIAFDFHKWLQVPYDAGCVLVKDERAHRAAFADRPDYLAPGKRGLAGGEPWFCEFGPELSRGFRALKIWFTLMTHGVDRLGAVIARNCRQAALLGAAVAREADLELLAPVSLNIVCFRFLAQGLDAAALDRLNEAIVAELQLAGIAAPSTTRIGGRAAIRVALTNHRTGDDDLGVLLSAVRRIGRDLSAAAAKTRLAAVEAQ